jgi:hypothetical protein
MSAGGDRDSLFDGGGTPMTESLLSFSNIDLFGHLLSDLKRVDPDRHVTVAAATTGNLKASDLRGYGPIDDVTLKQYDDVLVWQQKNIWQNGIYSVGAANENWRFRPLRVDIGGRALAEAGTEYARKRWELEDIEEVRRVSTQFKIKFKRDADPGTIKQIKINSVALFGTENVTGASPEELAAAVATEINKETNARYTATSKGKKVTIFAPHPDNTDQAPPAGAEVEFDTLTNLADIEAPNLDFGPPEEALSFVQLAGRYTVPKRRRGENRQLERQLRKRARFARIYGFSYEGTYYDLPRPGLFLVHGPGELVTQRPNTEDPREPYPTRAPAETTLTGLAAAGFDFADGLRVWSYDQADYTIRMDVETGMFEQVLLDAMFDGGGPGGFDSSGMNARGMNARGMNARGMNARGMNARGMNARGMNARGGGSD